MSLIQSFFQEHRLTKELLIYSPVYFFLTLINLRTKIFFTPDWFNGILRQEHLALLQFNYANNEQSRILQYLIPELLRHIFTPSIVDAYIIQRWTFTFLGLICFHFYLRKWFGVAASFAGVLFLAAILPLSYQEDLQESSSLLFLTFTAGLWAIRDRKTIALLLVYLVGGLNNETMLSLPLVYFFYNYKSRRIGDLIVLCRDTLLTSLPLLLTVGPMRYITRDHPHLGGTIWQLPENLNGILFDLTNTNVIRLFGATYFYVFFLFGMFWIYAFIRYKQQPLFLRRASLMIPFFIAAHLITGIISEVRQMVPLSGVIIPMALYTLFPSERVDLGVSSQDSTTTPSPTLTPST